MKICIYGAGAIGGILASACAVGGAEVSVVARGLQLEAIRARGLRVRSRGQDVVTHPRTAENATGLGVQDIIVVAVKAHAAPSISAQIARLCHDDTAVVPAVNGLPWWYFHGLEGPYRDLVLDSVDPGGVQRDCIGPGRVIGCVVYPAAEVIEPGVIEVTDGDRFSLGEPDGASSTRVTALAEVLRKGGLKAPVRPRIREEIWVKLWGNVSFNPISALTGGTLEQMCADPGTRALARAMMLEAETIAGKVGVQMPIDVDKRIAGAAAVGAHKTSMLQDLERGRPLEIDALVGSVAELGRHVGVPTPAIDGVLALVRLKAGLAGCYQAATARPQPR